MGWRIFSSIGLSSVHDIRFCVPSQTHSLLQSNQSFNYWWKQTESSRTYPGHIVFSSVCPSFVFEPDTLYVFSAWHIPFIYIVVLTLLMCSIIYKAADLNIRWAIEQTSGSVTFSLGTGWENPSESTHSRKSTKCTEGGGIPGLLHSPGFCP